MHRLRVLVLALAAIGVFTVAPAQNNTDFVFDWVIDSQRASIEVTGIMTSITRRLPSDRAAIVTASRVSDDLYNETIPLQRTIARLQSEYSDVANAAFDDYARTRSSRDQALVGLINTRMQTLNLASSVINALLGSGMAVEIFNLHLAVIQAKTDLSTIYQILVFE